MQKYIDASVKASGPDIKAFAAKTIPVLKMHLDMVSKMYLDNTAAQTKPAVNAAK